jgi:hypothetical protein
MVVPAPTAQGRREQSRLAVEQVQSRDIFTSPR